MPVFDHTTSADLVGVDSSVFPGGVELRAIPGMDRHLFGSDGLVRIRPWNSKQWRMARTRLRDGYPSLQIIIDGKYKWRGVHQLIAAAFYGPCPDGMECCHRDDVSTHNTPDNLYWGTRRQNIHDQIRRGVHAQCRKHPVGAKLTAAQIREIREAYAAGSVTRRTLADRYGVSRDTISRAANCHLDEDRCAPEA